VLIVGTIEKKKGIEEPEWLFCNHFCEKYQVPSFHFAGPAAGRIKGWILREIQSALKELWESM